MNEDVEWVGVIFLGDSHLFINLDGSATDPGDAHAHTLLVWLAQ